MSTGYYDFAVYLKLLDDEKIFLTYKIWPGLTAKSKHPYSDPPDLELENNENPQHISYFYNFGEKITEFLFPTEDLRQKFRCLWKDKGQIRIRLIYGINDRQELMKVLWEYAYLSKEGENHRSDEYFLGKRDDISIVHSLTETNTYIPMPIQNLPVRMSYFSAHDRKVDDSISEVFLDKYEKLKKTIIQSSNIEKGKIRPNNQHDVLSAMETDHLIHLTGHCETDKIINLHAYNASQPDARASTITLRELKKPFENSKKVDLKAVILLCCGTAGDGKGVALQLHELGVPVVIGMSRTIYPSLAKDFVKGFYQALANWPSDGLEKAIVSGRRTIWYNEAHLPNSWQVGYGLPRLFLHYPNSLTQTTNQNNDSGSILIPEDKLFGSDNRDSYFNELVAEKISYRPSNYDPNKSDWKKVTEWLNNPTQRWFLIAGPAMSGKSTQVAWFLDYFNPLKTKILYHFCQAASLKTAQPLNFVHNSLVPQLIDLYGEPYKEIIRERIQDGRYPKLVGRADIALIDFVIDPLGKLKEENPNHKEPVIIIDGIDFILPDHDLENSILGLIDGQRSKLDQVALVLVSAESDFNENVHTADSHTAVEIIDRIFHLTKNHDHKPDLEIEQFIDPKTHISRMQKRFSSPESKITTWGELYDLFDESINNLEKKYGKIVTRLLDLVTIAYEPLYIDDLVYIASCHPEIKLERTKKHLPHLLKDIQPFFKDFQIKENKIPLQKLALYQDRLQIHRLRKMNPPRNNRIAALTHELFVKAFRPRGGNWSKIIDWSELTNTKWHVKISKFTHNNLSFTNRLNSMARYAKFYLVDHAYYSYTATMPHESGARARRKKEFLNLICDPGYRTVRHYEVGFQESVEDLWKGLRVIYTEHIHNLSIEEQDINKTRVAFDELLAANQPGSNRNTELLRLEEGIRAGNKDATSLEQFLFK